MHRNEYVVFFRHIFSDKRTKGHKRNIFFRHKNIKTKGDIGIGGLV